MNAPYPRGADRRGVAFALTLWCLSGLALAAAAVPAGSPHRALAAATPIQNTWTPRGAGTPPGRASATMARDPLGRVVLFGGKGGDAVDLGDTWTWDGLTATWRPAASVTGRQPEARFGAAMAFDAARQQTLLFGGTSQGGNGGNLFYTMWIWDGNGWSPAPVSGSDRRPSGRYEAAMAFDEAHGDVVLFGGVGPGWTQFTDTWVWNGQRWTEKSEPQRSADNTPFHTAAGDVSYAMAWDGQEVVLFGADGSNGAETWVWDGAHWHRRSPQTDPGPVSHPALAYDPTTRLTILFGGRSLDPSPGDPTQGALADTWAWDGTNWSRLSPAVSPPRRVGPAMAYDATSDRIVLQGGAVEPVEPEEMSDTWTYDRPPTSPGQPPRQIPSVTTLTSLPNPSLPDQPVVITASVRAAATPPAGHPAPSGAVAFRDGSQFLGTAGLSGGGASLTRSLSAGTHPITAAYAGDATYLPSAASLIHVASPAANPPSLSTVTPPCAPTTGGSVHTLAGHGLVPGATRIDLAGTPLPPGSYRVVSPNSLTLTAPAHDTGTAPITVSTPAGTSNTVWLAYAEDPATCGPAHQVAASTREPGFALPFSTHTFANGAGGFGLGGPFTPAGPGQATALNPAQAPAPLQAPIATQVPVGAGSSGWQPSAMADRAPKKEAGAASETVSAMVRAGPLAGPTCAGIAAGALAAGWLGCGRRRERRSASRACPEPAWAS